MDRGKKGAEESRWQEATGYRYQDGCSDGDDDWTDGNSNSDDDCTDGNSNSNSDSDDVTMLRQPHLYDSNVEDEDYSSEDGSDNDTVSRRRKMRSPTPPPANYEVSDTDDDTELDQETDLRRRKMRTPTPPPANYEVSDTEDDTEADSGPTPLLAENENTEETSNAKQPLEDKQEDGENEGPPKKDESKTNLKRHKTNKLSQWFRSTFKVTGRHGLEKVKKFFIRDKSEELKKKQELARARARVRALLAKKYNNYIPMRPEEKPGFKPKEKRNIDLKDDMGWTDRQRTVLNDNFVRYETGDAITLKDLVGMRQVKDAVEQHIMYKVKLPDTHKDSGIPLKGGVLLWGPPGVGKSRTFWAVKHELLSSFTHPKDTIPMFFTLSSSTLTSKYHGESPKNVKAFFEGLSKLKNSKIILMDEVGGLTGEDSGSGTNEHSRTLLELLTALDGGTGASTGTYIIATCNQVWKVKDAFQRRLPGKVFVDIPRSQNEYLYLLRYYFAKKFRGRGESNTISQRTLRSAAQLMHQKLFSRCDVKDFVDELWGRKIVQMGKSVWFKKHPTREGFAILAKKGEWGAFYCPSHALACHNLTAVPDVVTDIEVLSILRRKKSKLSKAELRQYRTFATDERLPTQGNHSSIGKPLKG